MGENFSEFGEFQIIRQHFTQPNLSVWMTTNTIDNDTLTWILFHHSYRAVMVLSGQTPLSQGAYRLKIISASSRLTWVQHRRGTLRKEALVHLWQHPKYF